MTKYCREKSFCLVVIMLSITVIFTSCVDFFSTSLFPWAARNDRDIIPPITVDNVDEIIELFADDPDGSLVVLEKIQEAVEGASGDDKAILQAAAVEAAVNAVGLGQTIISSAGSLLDCETKEEARDVVLDAINGMPNLDEAGSLLFDILPDPLDPEFNSFTEKTSADDLAFAAILLISAEAKKNNSGNLGEYMDNYSSDPSPSAELAQAIALAAALDGREDELSESLKLALEGLNLVK